MVTTLAPRQQTQAGAVTLEQVLVKGDLRDLNESERVMYYKAVCESVGLNPLTKPFDYITLNGKLTLYAKKDATDQLRKLHGVSITSLETDTMQDVYIVKAHAVNAEGRQDTSTGAVSIKGLQGEALANAIMKAETKAKRRVTLSICGLGMLDETEVETIPSAQPAPQIRDITPAELPAPAAPQESKPLVSGDDVRVIYQLCEKLDWDMREFCGQLGVEGISDLTAKRAEKVIARLKEIAAQPPVVEPAEPEPAPEEENPFIEQDGRVQVIVPGLVPQGMEAQAAEAEELDRALGPSPVRAQSQGRAAGRTPTPTVVGRDEPPPDDFDRVPSGEVVGVTEKQLRAIYAIGRAAPRRWSDAETEARCSEMFGVHPRDLTKQEASQWLTILKDSTNA